MPSRKSVVLATYGALVLLLGLGCKSEPTGTGEQIENPRGPLSVGDVISLNVNGTDACANPSYRQSRVVAISARATILVDQQNPTGGFTTADFQRFGARFDTLVYPLVVEAFGAPTDVDKNGSILILFTRAVNALTPAGSNEYVGGFAYSRDLFPNTATARAQACAGSNQGEIFYMLTPDPTGSVNGNIRTVGFVDSVTTSVLAHEFEHIINASRRLYVNNTTEFEDKWLDEGLAHMAEELLFYRESKLAPRSNLGISEIRASAATRLAYNNDMSGNGARYRRYLQAPSTHSPYSANDSLETRGAAWSLLRYSLDRLNATDGFTAGNGQTVSGSGDVTLTAGTATGEYSVVVVNTALTQTGTVNFSVRATPAPGTILTETAGPVSSASRIPEQTGEPSLQRDAAFESRLRASERTLTPLMNGARAWYRSSNAGSPTMSRSASLGTSALADADGTLLFRLVNNSTIGFANLQNVVGGDLAGFVRDWNVSHSVDDVAALSTQYQQRSWNWRSIYPNLGSVPQAYPLLVTPLVANVTTSGSVVAGGAAYFRVNVSANGTSTVSLTGPAGAANPNLQLIVIRTR